MLKIILIILGVTFVVADTLLIYCLLISASRADRIEEKLYEKSNTKVDSKWQIFLEELFKDTILSCLTRDYGTKLSDNQRASKCNSILEDLKAQNCFTISLIQAILDKKGVNYYEFTVVDGISVIKLAKLGIFSKPKVCYFVTRTKEIPTTDYLDQILQELQKQAKGENIFS